MQNITAWSTLPTGHTPERVRDYASLCGASPCLLFETFACIESFNMELERGDIYTFCQRICQIIFRRDLSENELARRELFLEP